MSTLYANHSVFNEARYQTIGRGHGFSELDGVSFKISEKYNFNTSLSSNLVNELSNFRIKNERPIEEAFSYSFELEKKVLSNTAINGL